jgi:FixJ family two-component response regulator
LGRPKAEPIGTAVTDHPTGAIVAVVDDDPSIQKSLEYLLESADHTVLVFGAAGAMLESGCLEKIDCLISDNDMPVMDGFDLSQAVHAARPELPIILITGHPEMLDRLPPMDAGQRLVFKKPFDGQGLLTAMETLCAIHA